MPPPSFTRQNANEGLCKMDSGTAGQTQIELQLTSGDPSRLPTLPFLLCTICSNIEDFDFLIDTSVTVDLPDPAQLNINGGLKKLLHDVTATYHNDWEKRGVKFVSAEMGRTAMLGASLDWLSGISTVRHEYEKIENFESESRWRQYAEMEIGIMARHMVWWRLDPSRATKMYL